MAITIISKGESLDDPKNLFNNSFYIKETFPIAEKDVPLKNKQDLVLPKYIIWFYVVSQIVSMK